MLSTAKSVVWWSYFALQIAVLVASLLLGPPSVRSLALSGFFALGLVALWAYVRGIAIGPRWFWSAYFFLVMICAGIGIGSTLMQAVGHDAAFYLSVLCIGVVFGAPQWWVLWRYAFRSPEIWRPESTGLAPN